MTTIEGYCDPGFAPVREAFAENFAQRGEIDAAVAVTSAGRMVVDLWGGVADPRTGAAWERDTMVMVFSCTKGATALCAHLLAARGRLDLDAPVARYWPEFAAGGKESVAVRMLLNHQAAVPAVTATLPERALLDWQSMVEALAAQPPWWQPGREHGYHAVSFGFLVGEVVRRIDGRSLGRFFREEIASPLDLDFWIGLPESEDARVARLLPAPLPTEASPFFQALVDRATLTNRAFLNPPTLMKPPGIYSRAARAAEIPAANGIATACALAGLYAPLAAGGRTGNVPFVDRSTIERMSRVESQGYDRVLLLSMRFALGFMKSMDNRPADSARLGPNAASFGHAGAGGSIGSGPRRRGVDRLRDESHGERRSPERARSVAHRLGL
jgi:CubicO group peptidase (beta-lactamase class C family)